MSDQCAPLSSSSGPVLRAGEGPAPTQEGSLLGSGLIVDGGGATPFWTLARVALLLELRAKKWSGRRIAAELGVTRNAVMGKLARMGLKCESMRQPPRGRKRDMERKARQQQQHGDRRRKPPQAPPAPPKVADVAPELPPATRVSIYQLTPTSCRWPYGDPRDPDFVFCGAPAIEGSYCGHHARMAWAPPRGRGA